MYDFVAGRGTILNVLVVILVGIVLMATGRGGELSKERTEHGADPGSGL